MSEQGAPPAAPPASGQQAPAEGTPPPVEGQTPAATGAPVTPPTEHEVKIDGKTYRVGADKIRTTLGLEPGEPVGKSELRAFQMEVAARRRMSDAAREKQDAQRIRQLIREDPKRAIAELHFDGDVNKAREMLIDQLGRELEEATLDPKERQSREERRALEAKAKELEALKREREEQEVERRAGEIQLRATKIFGEALMTAGIDREDLPYALQRMASAAELLAQRGELESTDPAELAREIAAELDGAVKARLRRLKDWSKLAEIVGEDVVREWRRQDAGRVKRETADRAQTAPAAKPNGNGGEKKLSTEEFMRRLRAGQIT